MSESTIVAGTAEIITSSPIFCLDSVSNPVDMEITNTDVNITNTDVNITKTLTEKGAALQIGANETVEIVYNLKSSEKGYPVIMLVSGNVTDAKELSLEFFNGHDVKVKTAFLVCALKRYLLVFVQIYL